MAPALFIAAGLVCAITPPLAVAVTCTSQSELSAAERASLTAAARHFGSLIDAGNASAVKMETIPAVAEQFSGISAQIATLAPITSAATLTVVGLYDLDATDLTSAQDQTQFFCGGANSPEVVFSIPQIPPGHYAVAMLHATAVAKPQQMTFVLAQAPQAGIAPASAAGAATNTGPTGPWMLAGLYVRPMTAAGHDGLWYWNKARAYAQSKQNWNAYFYLQTAESLLVPVDFVGSPNLDKLIKEQNAVAPEALPGEKPMNLSANGHSYSITAMHTDGSLGALDLVIAYQAADNSDPVATRTRNVEVMHAMLTQHPELREGFHGLWVYSNVANQRTFANELPMAQIP
ncbi:MAG TPA: hypothetical protein VGD64_15150 [Acidisarcina sp.]